jgi:phage replication-related protein YjqB (UPF0714/DUF867 family)
VSEIRFRDLLARSDVVEESTLRSSFGILAFHGGALERVTDVVAREVAERAGASYYAVLHPDDASHVPSKFVDPEHSPALAAFLDHVDVALAIHGYGRDDRRFDVLLGGRHRALAAHLRAHLEVALPDYRHLDDLDEIPIELRGLHPDNPVNRPRAAGVQMELPPLLRWNREAWGWSDNPPTPRAPQVDVLIDTLAAAVSSFARVERPLGPG